MRGEITRTREGVMLPERNAFEFSKRPTFSSISEARRKEDSKQKKEDSKQKLMKSFLKLKKMNAPSTSANKFMAVVKYDY